MASAPVRSVPGDRSGPEVLATASGAEFRRPAEGVAPRRTVDVWASWNGATEIHWWRVLAGAAASSLRPVGPRVAIADLETHLRVRTSSRLVAVRALDAAGHQLGRA